MNLVWTDKSGLKGSVRYGENIAAYLINRGLAIDLDSVEVKAEPEPLKEVKPKRKSTK